MLFKIIRKDEKYFIIGNRTMTIKECANFFGVSVNTVHNTIKHYNDKQIEKWFNNTYVRKKHNLSSRAAIYWKGRQYCWLDAVSNAVGITNQSAGKRLKYWSKGLISCDEVFRPIDVQYSVSSIKSLNTVTTRIKDKKRVILFNNKEYSLKEFAQQLNVTKEHFYYGIKRILHDKKALTKYIDDFIWKKENNVPMKEKVYMNKQGVRCCVFLLIKKFELTRDEAKAYLKEWQTTNKKINPPVSKKTLEEIELGDLAFLSDEERPEPVFSATKYDKMLLQK